MIKVLIKICRPTQSSAWHPCSKTWPSIVNTIWQPSWWYTAQWPMLTWCRRPSLNHQQYSNHVRAHRYILLPLSIIPCQRSSNLSSRRGSTGKLFCPKRSYCQRERNHINLLDQSSHTMTRHIKRTLAWEQEFWVILLLKYIKTFSLESKHLWKHSRSWEPLTWTWSSSPTRTWWAFSQVYLKPRLWMGYTGPYNCVVAGQELRCMTPSEPVPPKCLKEPSRPMPSNSISLSWICINSKSWLNGWSIMDIFKFNTESRIRSLGLQLETQCHQYFVLAILHQEIQWHATHDSPYKLVPIRYVDNLLTVTDQPTWTGWPCDFYKDPIMLEDVKEQGLFLGFHIEINNRKLHFKYHWDHATWRIMSVSSAGSTHRKLSGLVSRCHLAKTQSYPFRNKRQSKHEI